MPSKTILISTALLLFVLSLVVHYLPLAQKGFLPEVDYPNLILARNLAAGSDGFKIENDKNVVLSTELIKEQGAPARATHKFTPYLYAQVFSIFGFNQQLPFYVNNILHSLTAVLFFFLVLRVFKNYWLAGLASLIYIFSPFILDAGLRVGTYEFALIFALAGLWAYSYNFPQVKISSLLLAGIFFALAGISRNTFLFTIIPFVFYEFWQNRSKTRLIVFLLPFIIIAGGWFLFTAQQGSLNFMLARDKGYNAHIFPDPYTYHFEKDAYLQGISQERSGELMMFLKMYGQKMSWSDNLFIYFKSFIYYLKNFLRLTTIGGPFILFFLVLGGWILYQKRRDFFKLFLSWFIVWFGSLLILQTSNYIHLVELSFPIVILIALGIYSAIDFILRIDRPVNKKFWAAGLLLVIFFHYFQANRWFLHEKYENASAVRRGLALVEQLSRAPLEKNDVMAVDIQANTPHLLNYYTNANVIYFAPETLERLSERGALQSTFDYFGVTKIVTDRLSEK